MIKLVFHNQEQKGLLLSSAGLAILFFFMTMAGTKGVPLSDALRLQLYWGTKADAWLGMTIALIPVFVFATLTSGFVSDDLDQALCFIAPRAKSFGRWLGLKHVALLLFSLEYAFVFCALPLVGHQIFSSPVEMNSQQWAELFEMFLCLFLFLFVAAICINTLSLLIAPKWLLVAFVFYMAVSMILAGIMEKSPVAWLSPVIHYFRSWQIVSLPVSLLMDILICVCCSCLGHLILVQRKFVLRRA
jgi:hypothetical protein